MTSFMGDNEGFTLLEIMVSIVVLAVLVVGGAAAFHYSGSMIQKQQSRRIAVAVATQEMEAQTRPERLDVLKNAGGKQYPVDTVKMNGIVYWVGLTTLYDGDNKLWVRVTVSEQNLDPFTLCYQALKDN